MPVTKYIWDGENCLMETDGTGAVQTVYTYEPEPYGNLISSRVSGTTYYHHYDALGSTRQLSNAAGVVSDTWIYDAWGNTVARTGATAIFLQWIGQVGYYYDPETGTFWVRERPLDPVNARWATIDPMDFVDGLTRFLYAFNSPLTFNDPAGTQVVIEPAVRGPFGFLPNRFDQLFRRYENDGCVRLRLDVFLNAYENLGGIVSPGQRYCLWNGGCIGLCAVAQNCVPTRVPLPSGEDLWPGDFFPYSPDNPTFPDPLSVDETTCFYFPDAGTAEAKAKAAVQCKPGEHKFTFAKQGRWKNGAAPGEGKVSKDVVVGSTDESDFNYVSSIGGYYWWINNARLDPGAGRATQPPGRIVGGRVIFPPNWTPPPEGGQFQEITICRRPSDLGFEAVIWCVTCNKRKCPQ